jgi:hypothetical protein
MCFDKAWFLGFRPLYLDQDLIHYQCPGLGVFRLGLGLTTLASLVLRPLGLDWNYTTGSLRPPVYRLWDLLASIITLLISYNKSLYSSIAILLVLFL